jgi:hypothetical protein
VAAAAEAAVVAEARFLAVAVTAVAVAPTDESC